MSENRCDMSGERVWRYGTWAYGDPPQTERVTCPGCGQRVVMMIWSGRLAEHDVIVVAAA